MEFVNRSLANPINIAPQGFSQAGSIATSTQVPEPLTLYKFQLNGRSSLNARLDGLTGDVNIALIQDKGNIGTIDAGEVLQVSQNPGVIGDFISRSKLDPGTYYLGISLGGANSAGTYSYTLGLNARPDSTADVLWRKGDTVGYWTLNGLEFGSETVINGVDEQFKGFSVEAIGDLSGDGTEDILWRNKMTGQMAIWLMESKTFATAQYVPFNVDESWQVHGIADIDGDGKGEVLWRHRASKSFAAWYMDGGVTIKSGRQFAGIDDAWDITGSGDFNGDGKAEILWRNMADSRVAMGCNGDRA
jgi:FG-GAP-like repeat